jgi:hypothetical protein
MEEQNETNINQRGRPRLNSEQRELSLENHREKARQRYNDKREICKEQAKENTKKVRQVYQIIKELAKNNNLDLIQHEETKNKLKEIFG